MTESEFVQKINIAGGKAYIVGGYLRDYYNSSQPKDKDYAITGISEEKFLSIFPIAKKTGTSFPVYRILIDDSLVEIAFARRDIKTGTGYKGFRTEFKPTTTIEDDLYRRDTTMNSIAKDLLTGDIIDPYNGITDIQNKVIKATSEHFIDDPVRALRAARQAAQFGFNIEKETLLKMEMCRHEIVNEPKERLIKELEHALKTPKPSIFFRNLIKAYILNLIYPPIYNLIGKTQSPKWHPEGDSFEHTMLSLDIAAELSDRIDVRFAALVHDIGKGATPFKNLPHHPDHESRGLDVLDRWNKEMLFPKEWISCARFAITHHSNGNDLKKPIDIVRMLFAIKNSVLGIDGFKTIILADNRKLSNYLLKYEYYIEELLKINGNMAPKNLEGAAIGKWLEEERASLYESIIRKEA